MGERLVGLASIAGMAGLMAVITRGVPIAEVRIRWPGREALLASARFTGWLALNLILWPRVFSQNAWLSNLVDFWQLLAILPGAGLLALGCGWADLGLGRTHLRANLRAALLAAATIEVMLVLLTPGGRFLRSGAVARVGDWPDGGPGPCGAHRRHP